jgi:pimeloyl-ACP methyl ester carboxylesterase/DNA-binding CsgD family transcriptional regulator
VDQEIGFLRAGGQRLAYATVGDGPPLVLPPWWVSHVVADWQGVRFRTFVEGLAAHRRVVRFDRLGTGYSDRERPSESYTLDAEVDALSAVADGLDLDSFALIGISCGGCTAARYAASNPERVQQLVLYGSYPDGSAVGPAAVRAGMVDVTRAHWGLGSRVLTDMFMPGASAAERDTFAQFQRDAASREVAGELLRLIYASDVREDLPRVSARTLVLHRRGDRAIPVRLGREAAALVRGARFVELDGRPHLPWHGDADAVLAEVAPFLGIAPPPVRQSAPDPLEVLSPREREVLRLVARGLTDAQIAEELVLSRHTVHRHVANIRTKLALPSRSAAAAHAARAGLV